MPGENRDKDILPQETGAEEKERTQLQTEGRKWFVAIKDILQTFYWCQGAEKEAEKAQMVWDDVNTKGKKTDVTVSVKT